MKQVRQTLFNYPFDNAEEFSAEISTEEDKSVLLDLKQALESAKNIAHNRIRTVYTGNSLKQIVIFQFATKI